MVKAEAFGGGYLIPEFRILQHHKEGVEIPLSMVVQPVADEASIAFLRQMLPPGLLRSWLLFGKQTGFLGDLELLQAGFQLFQQGGIVGLQDQGAAQGVAVIVEGLHVAGAKSHSVGDFSYIRLHIAGARADYITDGALLGFPLQPAEGAFVFRGKGVIDGDGIDLLFHCDQLLLAMVTQKIPECNKIAGAFAPAISLAFAFSRDYQQQSHAANGHDHQDHRQGRGIFRRTAHGLCGALVQTFHKPGSFLGKVGIRGALVQNALVRVDDGAVCQVVFHIVPGLGNGRAVANIVHICAGDFRIAEEVDKQLCGFLFLGAGGDAHGIGKQVEALVFRQIEAQIRVVLHH